jgi:RNA polymerase sigma-70 factor (ECF subfamily)
LDYEQVLPYIPNLRRYARALVGDRDSADDLVQDTLERAVRKFHLWRPGDLRAWLFSIMHNVFVNQLRTRRIPASQEVDENLAGNDDPAGATVVRDLERGLATLSAEQREVLLMVGLEDMSYAQVSRALGVPMGTVMSRLSRAREKLRRHMDGEPGRAGLKVVR